ncbi:cytoglobin-2-like [Battus philenor]|uniref:cytoglobin-2-like n=1 Tax=Battus philenor TaxID=42288 RepID=UPI0035D05A30
MGGILNRLWWGGDPDAPNPITGLTPRDVYAVQKSWAVIYAEAGKHGLQLFIRLFRLNPVTKTYFKTIKDMSEEQLSNSFQFKAHAINLMSSINTAVTNLNQPEVVIALMNKLGETHRKRRVEQLHFDQVKEVLVGILQKDLQLTDDVVGSWAKFVTFIYKHIFEILNDK